MMGDGVFSVILDFPFQLPLWNGTTYSAGKLLGPREYSRDHIFSQVLSRREQAKELKSFYFLLSHYINVAFILHYLHVNIQIKRYIFLVRDKRKRMVRQLTILKHKKVNFLGFINLNQNLELEEYHPRPVQIIDLG